MLSHLDRILFPDRCEVIEVIPSQRYVYPIFKNASSSLFFQAKKNKWKIKINDQIKKLPQIEVILRDPQQRLISGLNTYVQHMMRDNPALDQSTVLWFAKNYLYLNRHYCPQFFWLVNLARYLSPNTNLTFLSMDDIETITTVHKMPNGVIAATPEFTVQVQQIPNTEMYQRMDQVLVNQCSGQTMTFTQVLDTMHNQDPTAYDWVIGRAQRILNPTYVLP
jgi:hypothetical protein